MLLKKSLPLLLTSFLIFSCTVHTETENKKEPQETQAVTESSQKSARSSKVGGSKKTQTGIASYYADKFHGRTTANGERFNNHAMTAAHRSLPFGTKVKVTNIRNGKSVIVRINDRGPYTHGRIIDLSKAAARKIGITHSGVAKVKVIILK